ncbi:hypothetical protein BKP30_18620 [Rhodococcus erythropolis]|nr:hypothetical protein BKP30_18620 [Rhodococcus erythropolis]
MRSPVGNHAQQSPRGVERVTLDDVLVVLLRWFVLDLDEVVIPWLGVETEIRPQHETVLGNGFAQRCRKICVHTQAVRPVQC